MRSDCRVVAGQGWCPFEEVRHYRGALSAPWPADANGRSGGRLLASPIWCEPPYTTDYVIAVDGPPVACRH